MFLSPEVYRSLVNISPILCVDLVLRAPNGKYILFKRNNEPLKGRWWVAGGRVFKGESVATACRRKLLEETGIDGDTLTFRLLGFFQDVFPCSFVANEPYHAVSLVFAATIDPATIRMDAQHSEWGLFDTLPEDCVIYEGNT